MARQIVTGEIALHCGQAFVTEDPELINGFWEVPVWVVHPEIGKLNLIGKVSVCRRDGAVHFSEEDFRLLRTAGLEALAGVR